MDTKYNENGFKGEGQEANVEYNLAQGQHQQLERGLKSRHIQFLALGGAIGTGLFVGSGSILAETGPASLFMGYLSMMAIVWVVMNVLAEMVVFLPMRGISVPYFVGRFLDPSLAFAAGWNYFLFTWSIALLSYLNVSNTGATVFNWFVNISTISGFIAWIVVMLTYLRFRKAFEYNGLLHTLPYRTPLQPYATYLALFVITILTLTNGFQVFWPGKFSAANFLAAYITLPIFLVLYLGHKIYFRTGLTIKLEEIDVVTGKKEMDELADMEVAREPKNFLQKVWFWIA